VASQAEETEDFPPSSRHDLPLMVLTGAGACCGSPTMSRCSRSGIATSLTIGASLSAQTWVDDLFEMVVDGSLDDRRRDFAAVARWWVQWWATFVVCFWSRPAHHDTA
jgi:hypothetical protein